MTMKQLIFTAGLLHFCQAPAMMIAPHMLGWREDLARLQPINRRIVSVIGVSIMIVVLGLGIVVVLSPGELVNGGVLAAGLTCFLGVLFLFRGVVQVALYRKIWPRGPVGLASHYALTTLFFGLAGIYFSAFAWNLNH